VSDVETFFYPGRDGLRLGGRDYGPRDGRHVPIVCLAGLTRTSRDFHDLATALASGDKPRRVLALDYRGRGLSDRDPTGMSYTPPVEAQDAIDGMAARGVGRAFFVGTSRGGIVTMTIAGMRPNLVAGAVLNDIGSRIETAGLLRIKSYVGKENPPADWADAAAKLRELFGRAFPAYGNPDWTALARAAFAERDGRPVRDYDPTLARGLEAVVEGAPALDLGAAFALLAKVPVMVIRGGESDVLSRETVAAMAAAHPGLVAVEAPGEGHPPMLRGALLSRIVDFIDANG
jgi:pimeloyl-ACP methyl ester carboxylesterase